MVYKRGDVWWYRFKWSGTNEQGKMQTFVIRRSAKTANRNKARTVRDEHRHALRIGEVHPLDQWPKLKPQEKQVPTLREFMPRFLKAATEKRPGTYAFYKSCTANLLAFNPLAEAPLDTIDTELVGAYGRRRKAQKMSVIRINGEIRTLRRILSRAYEWREITNKPVIPALPNEERRERVLTPKEEAAYLFHATDNLRDATILAVDTGLRPNSELFVLQWSDVHLEDRRRGYIHVREGKTKNAVRNVPLTDRSRQVLLHRKKSCNSKYVFPGSGNSGHLASLQHPHEAAIEAANLEPFEFYCWRHTFATRCAQSGMDKFTLCRLMGHGSPAVAERYYVNIPESHVTEGFEKFDAFLTAAQQELNKAAAVQ